MLFVVATLAPPMSSISFTPQETHSETRRLLSTAA